MPHSKQSDWNAIAGALRPAIPEEAQAKSAVVLKRLETLFRRLEDRIPPDELMWSGAGDTDEVGTEDAE